MNASSEVVNLIATLHETQRRIEELTAGEVDSVMDGSGRISLLRSAQQQLRESESAKQAAILELQSANERLETFSYSVSHDLRAPLGHIIGYVEILQRRAAPSMSPEHAVHLSTILEAAVRMGALIDDLLMFSHTQHSELTRTNVDCNELVADVVHDFRQQTAARHIEWKIEPLQCVSADRSLLRMALMNLISNAVKFTGTRAKPRIEIGCALGLPTETVLFVRDNGAGFDPLRTDQLFGVFKRLHSASEFKGNGIGLASVQRIINRHGGRVWAEGAVDHGATFCFSMPKEARPA
jgi:light-regulated signal transduction histidine kinase (bacteriophytochrome)